VLRQLHRQAATLMLSLLSSWRRAMLSPGLSSCSQQPHAPARPVVAATTCFAARMAVGLRNTSGVINITQLRRNKRKRPDKTSGRKRPRQAYAGLTVVPAPDADDEPDVDGDPAPSQPHAA